MHSTGHQLDNSLTLAGFTLLTATPSLPQDNMAWTQTHLVSRHNYTLSFALDSDT